ncbi:MAG: spore cortex biosynthesis protein YabQ [Clostridia bacterium]|nr:spore cortex biosynthesis protein YabQ [Clostridia bacterium]
MNSTVQIYEFMGCVYAGIIMGVIYAILDYIKGNKDGAVITAIFDAVFLVICTAIAAVSLYYLTYGRVSLYHFIAFPTGIFLYVKCIHNPVSRVLRKKDK